MHQLSAFQRDVLFILLQYENGRGLFIKDKLEEYYDKTIHDGQLYPNIDALVEEGYIKKWKHNGRTNKYALTNKGKKIINERHTWENSYINPNSIELN